MFSMRQACQWLQIDDRPAVWFSRYELETCPHAPATPIESWSDTETLAAMLESLSRRSEIKEVTTAKH
jgi:hypothetical protein